MANVHLFWVFSEDPNLWRKSNGKGTPFSVCFLRLLTCGGNIAAKVHLFFFFSEAPNFLRKSNGKGTPFFPFFWGSQLLEKTCIAL